MGDELTTNAANLSPWSWQQLGAGLSKFSVLRPDFLIISPPKTGSTWLAENLRCHPQVFVPRVKELKYFSSFLNLLDLNWYLDQFAPAAGRLKGEASPSYALLPIERIRLVRQLFPEVKLVFLMREPVARAWSHAKHNHRYGEVNFATCTVALDAVTDREWQENFLHPWPLASGDYLGQLRRWLSVFPAEQIYVDFYEAIASQPASLLRRLFAFLGVDGQVDLNSFPLTERVLPGPAGELAPALQPWLYQLLHARTLELASFLRERFNLHTPAEWQSILDAASEPPAQHSPCAVPAFDNLDLSRVLEYEEASPRAQYPVLEGYRGYNVVHHHGWFYALAQSLGTVSLWKTDVPELEAYEATGRCFRAQALTDVKNLIDQYVFEQMGLQLRNLESLQNEVRDARERIASLECSLAETLQVLRGIDEKLARRRPWYVALARLLRGAARRLRAAFRARSVGKMPDA